MLTERQEAILSALVPEYIARAVPIGSEFLSREYPLEASPATIRNELFALTRMGYLEQPHTSAGRVPTDRGYRFYVNLLLENERENAARQTRQKEEFFRSLEGADSDNILDMLVNSVLSRFSDTLVWGVDERHDRVIFDGLDRILHHPEFRAIAAIERFLDVFEYMRQDVDEILQYVKNAGKKVFIGEEFQPVRYHDCSILISSVSAARGSSSKKRSKTRGTIWIAFIGPKRMRYKEHLKLLSWLEEYYGRRKKTNEYQ